MAYGTAAAFGALADNLRGIGEMLVAARREEEERARYDEQVERLETARIQTLQREDEAIKREDVRREQDLARANQWRMEDWEKEEAASLVAQQGRMDLQTLVNQNAILLEQARERGISDVDAMKLAVAMSTDEFGSTTRTDAALAELARSISSGDFMNPKASPSTAPPSGLSISDSYGPFASGYVQNPSWQQRPAAPQAKTIGEALLPADTPSVAPDTAVAPWYEPGVSPTGDLAGVGTPNPLSGVASMVRGPSPVEQGPGPTSRRDAMRMASEAVRNMGASGGPVSPPTITSDTTKREVSQAEYDEAVRDLGPARAAQYFVVRM